MRMRRVKRRIEKVLPRFLHPAGGVVSRWLLDRRQHASDRTCELRHHLLLQRRLQGPPHSRPQPVASLAASLKATSVRRHVRVLRLLITYYAHYAHYAYNEYTGCKRYQAC